MTRSDPRGAWMSGALVVALMAAIVSLQHTQGRLEAATPDTAENLLYVRSPAAMSRMALSYDAVLADLYWIRAVQHYGGTRLSTDPNKQYDLLYPLLDLTTSLDPRFNVAYYFGSTFLAEAPPDGPGRPDLAIVLLEKGLRVQPDKWEFAQWIGFVHYWWRHDYAQAAEWFQRAGDLPGAPFWLAQLAATTLAEGGNRQSSRLLWQEVARTGVNEAFRNEAVRRLQQLDAMDQIDQLFQIVGAFQQRYGAVPRSWDDLGRAGYLRSLPVDPTGVPYRLEAGSVALGEGSRLSPLPREPQRLIQ